MSELQDLKSKILTSNVSSANRKPTKAAPKAIVFNSFNSLNSFNF